MRKKLGDILLEGGCLTRDQYDYAVREHKLHNMKFGQFIVREGFVEEERMIEVLSKQLRLERYRPEVFTPEPALSEIISADFANRLEAVPVRNGGMLISVAMMNPLDISAIDTLESITDKEIKAVLCTEREYNELFQRIYGANIAIEELIKNISPEDENFHPEEDYLDMEIGALKGLAEDAPVIKLVDEIMEQAIRQRASDVHISPEKNRIQLRFRVDGKLQEVPSPPKRMLLSIVSRIKLMAKMDIAAMRVPQDGRFSIIMNHKEIHVRASTVPTIFGENLVLRLLDTGGGVFTLEQLGMTEEDQNKMDAVLGKPYGMILSTGPTGSGKTTSLYSILKEINQPDVNIITLEDPVEIRIDGIRQTQLNRKAGMTFASGIRSVLRQDPDVIMVGEVRDEETAAIAIQAALTGHKVLSTLHTNNAAGAITRFIDMKIAPFLISSVLLLLMAQRLVRMVCPECRRSFLPTEAALDFWGISNLEGAEFYQASGCHSCMHTGYKDRTGVFEVLVVDDMVQEMILNSKSATDITRAAQKSGKLKTLKENAAIMLLKGITTFEEAGSVVML